MPRLLVQAPNHDRTFSLGWLALEWMEALTIHGDGDVIGDPVHHTDEASGLVLDSYALNPPDTVAASRVGRRLYDSVFYSRPKGADKSGQGARFGLFEALGPCRFAGIAEGGEVYRDPYGLGFEYHYVKGEPMGRHVRTPFIRIMATEEEQTGNVYDNIYYNLIEGPLSQAMTRRDDAGLTRILLPDRGEITPSTSSSASKDGGKETFGNFDETHLYNTPELRRMYATVTRNLRKRKKIAETWYLETTTMYAEGENSVAERTYQFAEAMLEGRTRAKTGLLLDHQWGECADLTDIPKLKAALAESYGDAMEWMDVDSLVDEFFDPRKDPEDSRRYFLNARTTHSNAFIRTEHWNDVRYPRDDKRRIVAEGETITLGFDGSRKRSRGVTDSTALVGCRVSDGFLFTIAVWEQPADWPKHGDDWVVPTEEVDAAVDAAFEQYRVVAFYADPAKWESFVASWEAKYRKRLKVKVSEKHPIEWWMIGGDAKRVFGALTSFEDAVIEKQLAHGSDADDKTVSGVLTRHVLNARRRPSRNGYGIHKEHPNSANKIDVAVAAVLAYQARLDALAKGVTVVKRRRKAVSRIR